MQTSPTARHDDSSWLLVRASRVYTHFPFRSAGDAVLVQAGHVVAVGRQRALRKHAPPRARVLDLEDAVLTPGLIDAHTHFFYWALQQALVIDVTGFRSLAETLAAVRSGGARRRVGAWVLGRGFDVNLWQAGFPAAADLDRAIPDAPCMLRSRDGHVAWLNTAALRACGIDERTPNPPGGEFRRDRHGRPNGLVLEAALDALPNPLGELARSGAPRDLAVVDRALQRAFRAARALGFVGVHVLDDAASLSTFQRWRQSNRLPLRIVHSVPFDNRARAYELGLRGGVGDEWLRLAAIKIFSDGTLGSQTALMFDAYPGRARDYGVGVVHGEALRDAAIAAAAAGWPLWVHAIGDRAVSETIDALAAARRLERQARGGVAALRHRIEHTQCIRPRDVRRMASLGIIASVQPCHLLGDIATAERYWPRARRHAYALRALRAAGVLLAMGSDVPVEPLDPRRSFYAALCRQDEHGHPVEGWFPEQRISAADVLRGFTQDAAQSVQGAPPLAGTLLPGAAADMTIWGGDPLRWPAADFREIPIRGSIVAGRP